MRLGSKSEGSSGTRSLWLVLASRVVLALVLVRGLLRSPEAAADWVRGAVRAQPRHKAAAVLISRDRARLLKRPPRWRWVAGSALGGQIGTQFSCSCMERGAGGAGVQCGCTEQR